MVGTKKWHAGSTHPYIDPIVFFKLQDASDQVGFPEDGLQVNLQVVGRHFSEKTLLRVSTCF